MTRPDRPDPILDAVVYELDFAKEGAITELPELVEFIDEYNQRKPATRWSTSLTGEDGGVYRPYNGFRDDPLGTRPIVKARRGALTDSPRSGCICRSLPLFARPCGHCRRSNMTQSEFNLALRDTFEAIRNGWSSLQILHVFDAMQKHYNIDQATFRDLLEAGLADGSLHVLRFEVQRATCEGVWLHGQYRGALVRRPKPSNEKALTLQEVLDQALGGKRDE